MVSITDSTLLWQTKEAAIWMTMNSSLLTEFQIIRNLSSKRRREILKAYPKNNCKNGIAKKNKNRLWNQLWRKVSLFSFSLLFPSFLLSFFPSFLLSCSSLFHFIFIFHFSFFIFHFSFFIFSICKQLKKKKKKAYIKVQEALQKGLDPNFVSDAGETPLMMAVVQDDPQMIMMLVKQGGSFLDYRTPDWKTPVHRAVILGHEKGGA